MDKALFCLPTTVSWGVFEPSQLLCKRRRRSDHERVHRSNYLLLLLHERSEKNGKKWDGASKSWVPANFVSFSKDSTGSEAVISRYSKAVRAQDGNPNF